MRDAVIVSTARTPMAKSWRGSFNMTHGATLGAHAVQNAVSRAKVDPADQTHVFTSVQPLAPGSYTIRYRAISVDSFLASGSWTLTVVAKPQSVGQLINR